MELDLTGREYLTPFELLFLVNGCRRIWDAAYNKGVPPERITIYAQRQVYQQIKLVTRWVDRRDYDWKKDRGTGRLDPRLDQVTMIEVRS